MPGGPKEAQYALMQLIAETYHLMKRGLGLNDDELREVYDSWNQGELNGYLIEITSHSYRSAWLPANLIQAQRDYFGAHTYERIDVKGTFHTEWGKA
jgi:6-phosphogluconate dehydrogenase